MIDIQTTIRATPKKIQRKSNGVSVRMQYALTGKDKTGYFKLFKGTCIDSLSQFRRPHIFIIKRYGFGKTAKIKAICDCENFKYVWEVALIKQKSSVKCFSNGKKPVITNPKMKPGMCKHLIAALKATIRLSPTKMGKIMLPRGF